MITSKLRPGRINGFEQYVYQKQATKEYNLSICDYIPQAKECLKTCGVISFVM